MIFILFSPSIISIRYFAFFFNNFIRRFLLYSPLHTEIFVIYFLHICNCLFITGNLAIILISLHCLCLSALYSIIIRPTKHRNERASSSFELFLPFLLSLYQRINFLTLTNMFCGDQLLH